ncbi:hypothetical protein PF005_g9138 [Phytophthora fragariae]|uniref:Uncharacterized protein n=1 Tax=Phytophthora fragariae TaxID=53985 RepID=A0A6A3YCG7_9STRA|nr:hypothetical protein PF005_g9138 [Phytophthora fragariae]
MVMTARTAFDEAQQAEKDKKKRKLKRLSAAGNKAMRNAAQRLKRRKAEASRQERSNAPEASEDDEHAVQRDASEAESAASDERTGLRIMLGGEYSSDEETRRKYNEESDQTEEDGEEDTQSGHKVDRTRLRVSEIWAREEAMMAKDRAAQAARDNALTRAVETLANTTCGLAAAGLPCIWWLVVAPVVDVRRGCWCVYASVMSGRKAVTASVSSAELIRVRNAHKNAITNAPNTCKILYTAYGSSKPYLRGISQ